MMLGITGTGLQGMVVSQMFSLKMGVSGWPAGLLKNTESSEGELDYGLAGSGGVLVMTPGLGLKVGLVG